MGPTGTGSLEEGDASGEMFWMKYPSPFLEYFYDTFPLSAEDKPQPPAALCSQTDCEKRTARHPDYPNLAFPYAEVYKYFTDLSDDLCEMGPKSGQFSAQFVCIIPNSDGTQCGTKRDEESDSAQIFLRTEVVDFDVFPLTSKTGDSIRIWFVGVLKRAEIPYAAVSGVTLDGAADGQCGLSLIAENSEKVDTCILHQLQRSVLYSIGLAGVIKDEECGLQGYVEEAQPDSHTHPSISFIWQENRQNKEAIVETNASEEGSKVGVAVAASEIGLDLSDWDRIQELEGFLSYPYAIKDTLEHSGVCTGSQAMILLHDLKENFCNAAATLEVKQFPETLRLAHRSRTSEIRAAQDISTLITSAREITES
ncbi:hypothetical protein CYMTET_12450 [Cymbomonas tetramitiformis]|uniref:Uncharacterized protein n=1 Tax=Cymbomonas tetramitiformis TaxID=36881 RepID=A0AAE0LCE8_9CHLO|nr:hypothetical protein CYMTET_12450 [Cymbomonas tetramitiformis]